MIAIYKLILVSCDSPLYIRPHSKAVLNKAIEEDTKFLANNCVMDYSLLVGLEPNSDELVLGIIGKKINYCLRINLLIFIRINYCYRLHKNIYMG